MNLDIKPRACAQCCKEFQPKPNGNNAKYCADKCKRASQRKRVKAVRPHLYVEARRRSFEQTMKHPERIAKTRDACAEYRKRVRDWLADYKLSRGCVDCGYKEYACALQLDHEGPKSIEIGRARTSIARVQREIIAGKCKVRCANCHSIITWKRKQPWYVQKEAA